MKLLANILVIYMFTVVAGLPGMKLLNSFGSCNSNEISCCSAESPSESESDSSCEDCSFCLICSCCSSIVAPVFAMEMEKSYPLVQSTSPSFLSIPHPGKFIPEIWQPPRAA